MLISRPTILILATALSWVLAFPSLAADEITTVEEFTANRRQDLARMEVQLKFIAKTLPQAQAEIEAARAQIRQLYEDFENGARRNLATRAEWEATVRAMEAERDGAAAAQWDIVRLEGALKRLKPRLAGMRRTNGKRAFRLTLTQSDSNRLRISMRGFFDQHRGFNGEQRDMDTVAIDCSQPRCRVTLFAPDLRQVTRTLNDGNNWFKNEAVDYAMACVSDDVEFHQYFLPENAVAYPTDLSQVEARDWVTESAGPQVGITSLRTITKQGDDTKITFYFRQAPKTKITSGGTVQVLKTRERLSEDTPLVDGYKIVFKDEAKSQFLKLKLGPTFTFLRNRYDELVANDFKSDLTQVSDGCVPESEFPRGECFWFFQENSRGLKLHPDELVLEAKSEYALDWQPAPGAKHGGAFEFQRAHGDIGYHYLQGFAQLNRRATNKTRVIEAELGNGDFSLRADLDRLILSVRAKLKN